MQNTDIKYQGVCIITMSLDNRKLHYGLHQHRNVERIWQPASVVLINPLIPWHFAVNFAPYTHPTPYKRVHIDTWNIKTVDGWSGDYLCGAVFVVVVVGLLAASFLSSSSSFSLCCSFSRFSFIFCCCSFKALFCMHEIHKNKLNVFMLIVNTGIW